MNRRTFLPKLAVAAAIGVVLSTGYFIGEAQAERQPRMQAALDHLVAAERDLEAATSDKGGHRNAALRSVRNAIAEVKKGIRFDNRH